MIRTILSMILLVSTTVELAQEAPRVSTSFQSSPPIPAFLRGISDRAAKGDVDAMIQGNVKCVEAGLPKRHADEAILMGLQQRTKAGDLKAEIALLTKDLLNEYAPVGVAGSVRNPRPDPRISALVKRLADSGDPDGMCGWSMLLYRSPIETRKDEEIAFWYWKAWDHYESRAKTGEVKAMLALLEMPVPPVQGVAHKGIGDRRAYWREQAAIRGDAESMRNMGYRLFKPRKTAEWLSWFQRSAEVGDWKAMLQLATIYGYGTIQRFKGEEPKPDPVKSWYWLDKAVEVTGNPEIWKKFTNPDEPSIMIDFPPRPGAKAGAREAPHTVPTERK